MPDLLDRPRARAAEREHRGATIHVRAPQRARDLIGRAAEASGKTITDFVLDSATRHAVDVLLDQRLFMLDPARYDAFAHALDNPPLPGPKLKGLMKRRAAWET